MSNLYIYLIRSRHKDNESVKGFKPRTKYVLEYEENEHHVLEEFEDFAKKGLPGEKTRLYKSVNSRNEDKIRHNLIIRMLRDATKLPTLNNTMATTAMRAECRNESKWLFDFDIDDENTVSMFAKDIPVKTSITKTPHGYAVVCEHGFDTRPLHEKWKTQIDNGDITLKRDDMLFMSIRTSEKNEVDQ